MFKKRDSVQTFDLAWRGHLVCGSRGGSGNSHSRRCIYFLLILLVFFVYLVVYIRWHYFSHLVVWGSWRRKIAFQLLYDCDLTHNNILLVSYTATLLCAVAWPKVVMCRAK